MRIARFTLALLIAALAFTQTAKAAGFKLKLDGPDTRGQLAQRYSFDRGGCSGENIAPALAWSTPPQGTRSLALSVFDPDASGGWWHWLLIDIPASTRKLPSRTGGADNIGRPLRNDFGTLGYGGPCPPRGSGAHHYVFTIYALDVAKLDIDAGMSPNKAARRIRAHVLAKASTTATFARSR